MQRNVLIIGKSPSVRENLAQQLREGGHQVVVAGAQDDVQELARNAVIDTALIEQSGDLDTGKLRDQIQLSRPNSRVVCLNSLGQARRSGQLLSYGDPDYIVTDRELIRLTVGGDADAASPDHQGTGESRTSPLIQVIDVLVSLLEVDDAYFGGFSHQVTTLVRSVGAEMGLDEDVLNELVVATLLRDIGKIGVKRQLLEAEDRYSSSDREEMKAHATWTVRLLEHIEFGSKVLPIVRFHHERYDGTGYPDGLRGRGIPLGARIVSVCESFAAMLSDRPHRPARSFDEAVDELMSGAGTHFDPEVVEVLMRIVEKGAFAGLIGRKAPVLLIDPEAEFRRLLKIRLLNLGINVRAVSHIDGDLASYTEPCPALILVDSGEDGLHAFEIINRLEELQLEQHTPVAVLARQDDRLVRLNALRHGIDDYILKSDDLEEAAVRVENILTREARRRGTRVAHRTPGVTGRIENLSLSDIVQMLSLGSKTGSVTLRSDDREGKIWFKDGKLVHAKCAEKAGEAAFYEMLKWTTGEFVINHGVTTDQTTVNQDAMYLLMEGMRQIDEGESPDKNSPRPTSAEANPVSPPKVESKPAGDDPPNSAPVKPPAGEYPPVPNRNWELAIEAAAADLFRDLEEESPGLAPTASPPSRPDAAATEEE